MPALFAITLFLSALLLFFVQPMIARMILPKFGGTPAVWNTCMVFFQALLLAGYSYAHATTSWLGTRRQTVLHLILLLLPALILPIAVDPQFAPPGEANPIPYLLGLLAVTVGLPFFMLSTGAPLLQKWFAGTGHASAKDPYFLYAASNVGSMLALLIYPALTIPLGNQSRMWAGGYVLLLLLVAGCGLMLWRSADTPETAKREAPLASTQEDEALPAPTRARRLHWIALAFVPSSLMLGVTMYLSTDLTPMPLLWVIPLALYLLSFIIVFSKLPPIFHTTMVVIMPVIVLAQILSMISEWSPGKWGSMALHLVTFFTVALVCHGELAGKRPAARYLTEFYLWMSLGGVLGGICNALVAPLIFKTVAEYPLVLVLACLLMPRLETPVEIRWNWLDFCLPCGLLLAAFGLILLMYTGNTTVESVVDWLNGGLEKLSDYQMKKIIRLAVSYGIPLLICFLFVTRPIRFGLGVGALLLAHAAYDSVLESNIPAAQRVRALLGMERTDGIVLMRHRGFFGVLKVERRDGCNRLIHGTTVHGTQRVDDDGLPVRGAEPSTYYHPQGPIGQLFEAFKAANAKGPLAFIGLGTGTLACYGQPGQKVTFFEIDPAVIDLANNEEFFSYLASCRERQVQLDIVPGDARLSLRKVNNPQYQLIVVDAFSSDAIPVHLITREALEMYRDKLGPHGIVAFHISNRYLDLEPVLANLARALDMKALVQHGGSDKKIDKDASSWVLLARREADFDVLAKDIKDDKDDSRSWYRIEDGAGWYEQTIRRENVGIWTDDYSNILSIFLWK